MRCPAGFRYSTITLCVVFTICAQLAAAEKETEFYPIIYDTDTPHLLSLVDDIDIRTPVMLSRALKSFPHVTQLSLSSRGGSVHSALTMSYVVHEEGLRTLIPDGAVCFSACSYLFFAGAERAVQGALGVHQLASASDSLRSGQVALADIMAAYDEFGVNGAVVNKMLLTPADDMYVFDTDELSALGIVNSAPCAGADAHLDRVRPLGAQELRLHVQTYRNCPSVRTAETLLAKLAAADTSDLPVAVVNAAPPQDGSQRCTDADGWDQILRVCRAALAARDWGDNEAAALQNAIGAAFLATGDAFAAHEAFQAALALRPDTPVLLENRALALDALGQHADAALEMRAAIGATSAPPDRFFARLGLFERSADKVNTAFQVWDGLLSDDGTSESLIRAWQEALASSGHLDQTADGRYTTLTRIAVQRCSFEADCLPPGADTAPELLPVPVSDTSLDLSRSASSSLLVALGEPDGQGSCNQGQPEMNIHMCEAMLQEGAFDAEERTQIANFLTVQYAAIDAYEEADAVLTRAINAVAPDYNLFRNRAAIRYHKGDYAGALEDVDAVRALTAHFQSFFSRETEVVRGNILARLGRADEAVEAWMGAIFVEDQDETDTSAQDLQRFLQKAGFYTGAIDGKFGAGSRAALAACAAATDCVMSGQIGYGDYSEAFGLSYVVNLPEGPLYYDTARREHAKAAMAECQYYQDDTIEQCTRAIDTGWLLTAEAVKAYRTRSDAHRDAPQKRLADYQKSLRMTGFQSYDRDWYVRLLLMADQPENALLEVARFTSTYTDQADFYRGLALAALGRNAEAERIWLAHYDRLDNVTSDFSSGGRVFELYQHQLERHDMLPAGYNQYQDGKTSALRAAIGRCASDPACYTLK
ncbi:hypothetical protein [Antarctobacter heliothermus]|uniref:Tetratricopeptide repeat protein n=1 Tax=Antarctobacter heliothermus TaxID=74033 RepID=A0A239B6G8_9RHOB|nr:hypothetical protein [Antarctobacter heliothermus]SNS03487.1 hypothetical protein SAMN04488078_1002105 [Antarctobacter heliothermus]